MHARLFVLPNVFLLATCAVQQAPEASVEADRGAALYAHHCAVCHGPRGDADTLAADLLRPRPTAFRQGLFKLVSTQNGMPTEADIVQTLRRGMPGSTMMSWSWMPESDLQLLAHEVRRLAVRGRAESIHRTAAIAGRKLTMEQATATAERQLLPGSPVDVGQPAARTPATLAEGERLYRLHCASCHGADGRGLPALGDWPTDGTWLLPRDFTAGYLRGAATHRDIVCRIRAGMPGAHMPPTLLSTDETDALADYVRGLLPEGASDHHTQWRRTVRVPRSAALPVTDDDDAFAQVDAIRLPLAPLWWRPEACSEVLLRVAHDGNSIVVRLEWSDGSRDDLAQPDGSMGDGAAIQFARAVDPPLFAMGSRDQPVNVWRWHAFDPKETAGMTDLVAPNRGLPHRGLDVQIGSPLPDPRAESIQLGGVQTVSGNTGTGLPLQVQASWHSGRWTATFRRSLRARDEREVDLTSPGPVLFALAVWDGRIDKHAGSKAITTWHVLELQR